MIMEAEKLYDMSSASRRTEKVSGVIQSEFKGLRPRGCRCLNSQFEAEGMRTRGWAGLRPGTPVPKCSRRRMSQLQKGRNSSSFLYVFVLFGPSTDWVMPTHIDEGIFLLSLLTQVLISSVNTFTVTARNTILPAIWESLSQSSGHIKLTITLSKITSHMSPHIR